MLTPQVPGSRNYHTSVVQNWERSLSRLYIVTLPGMLQFMGLQRVRHGLATEQ